MATIKLREALVDVEFVTHDPVPFAANRQLPLNAIKRVGAQPSVGDRNKIVLAIEQQGVGQFVLYRRSPQLDPPLFGASPASVKLELGLLVDDTNLTDTVVFTIPPGNDLDTTDFAFLTADLMFYVAQEHDANGSVNTLFSVSLDGGGGGDPCAGKDAPASAEARTLFALLGCYS